MRIDVDIAYSYRVIVVKVLVTVVVMVYVVSHSSSFRCVYMPAKHYILLKKGMGQNHQMPEMDRPS